MTSIEVHGGSEGETYGTTAAEWLRRWDKGESVWSLEMGGLGPGYEQCIQIACAEVVRDMHDKPVPEDDDIEGRKAWTAQADAALDRADKLPGMGMSGAQAGAARSLAFMLCKMGPAGFFAHVRETYPERAKDMIQVSREWPRAEAH